MITVVDQIDLFLEKLKAARKEKGISQEEMSKKLGINKIAYNRIENGKTKISFDRLVDIINILGEDFVSNLDNSIFPSFNKNEIDELKSKIEKLENENKRLVKENEDLIRELDNYQTFINLLKDRNMITSPQRLDKGDLNEVIESLDELLNLEELSEEETKKDNDIIEEIKNNQTLKRCLEDGTIITGRYYHVWKEYLENK